MRADLRCAYRNLRQRPAFTILAVLVTAMGIGTSSAAFNAVNALFLRQASGVRAPDRLVVLGRRSGEVAFGGFGYRSFLDYRAATRSFSGLAAWRNAPLLWRTGEEPVVLSAELVTPEYFGVLDLRPARGRLLSPRDPPSAAVAVLGHDFWRRHHASDPRVIGSTLRLNETEFTVIGIASPGFRGLDALAATDVWLPLGMEAAARPLFPALGGDLFRPLRIVARLAPGSTRERARAELAVLSARSERADATNTSPPEVVVSPHIRFPDRRLRADAAASLALVSAAAGILLLISCANLAGLLLTRAAQRTDELAVRLALGARRSRVVRHLLSEGLLVALAAVPIGVLVARGIAALIRLRTGPELVLTHDLAGFAFIGAAALATTTIAGLIPALLSTHIDPAAMLRVRAASTPRRRALRRGLVGAQAALAVLLLAGAALLTTTLRHAAAVDVGIEKDALYIAAPDLSLAGYDAAGAHAFYRTAEERLADLPGVTSVSRASAVPRYGGLFWDGRRVMIERGARRGLALDAAYNEVGARYFETVGLELQHGRTFTAQDRPEGARVAIVNEALARRISDGAPPLGVTVRFDRLFEPSEPLEIVGVAKDARTLVLEQDVAPEIYVPAEQGRGSTAHLLVRTSTPIPGLAREIHSELRAIDPELPPFRVETLAEGLAGGLDDQRLFAELTALFAVLALLLAAAGLYGTLALDVVHRTPELGVRIALGGTPRDLLRLVLRDGFVVVGTGIVIGTAASFALLRLIASRLYGVTPTDPRVLAGAGLVLLAAALLASWAPARRAAGIQPLDAIRRD